MNRLANEGHKVEEINGIRCAIVEKNASPERVKFLKTLLEHNGYSVMTASTPQPPVKKTIAPSNSSEGKETVSMPVPSLGGEGGHPAPSTFTVGVTDITFHPMLSVYERSLLTTEGQVVSIAYWNQQPDKEGEVYWMKKER